MVSTRLGQILDVSQLYILGIAVVVAYIFKLPDEVKRLENWLAATVNLGTRSKDSIPNKPAASTQASDAADVVPTQPAPVPEGTSPSPATAADRHGKRDLTIHFFIVGCIVLALAVGLVVAAFTIADLTFDQQRILGRFVFPMAAGFAAASFLGTITVSANGGGKVPLVISATGGFAVFMVISFTASPDGPEASRVLVVFKEASSKVRQPINGMLVVTSEGTDYHYPLTSDDHIEPTLLRAAIGKRLELSLIDSTHIIESYSPQIFTEDTKQIDAIVTVRSKK